MSVKAIQGLIVTVRGEDVFQAGETIEWLGPAAAQEGSGAQITAYYVLPLKRIR